MYHINDNITAVTVLDTQLASVSYNHPLMVLGAELKNRRKATASCTATKQSFITVSHLAKRQ